MLGFFARKKAMKCLGVAWESSRSRLWPQCSRCHHEDMDKLLSGRVKLTKSYGCRYCRQVLCETVRTAKLTPIAAQLQELEGRVDQHTIPKEVGQYWEHQSTFLSWRGICHFLFFLQGGEAGRPFLLTLLNPSSCSGISKYSLARSSPCSSSVAEALGIHGLFLSRFASSSGSTRGESSFEGAYGFSCA